MTLKKLLRPHQSASHEEHWVPLTDLMTGLMMMFLLVAIIFMVKVEDESKKVKSLQVEAEARAGQMQRVAELYDQMRESLYEDLLMEFQGDLPQWKATLDRDLTMRFTEPEVMFDVGKAVVKDQFRAVLNSFFPRYVRILSSGKYRDSIEEIRIEGHTSTIWSERTPADEAYFKNMELSQSRTRTTLEYALLLPEIASEKEWLIARLTANGLSSSSPRFHRDGTEDRAGSQRVEFKVRTNADKRIGDILKVGAQ